MVSLKVRDFKIHNKLMIATIDIGKEKNVIFGRRVQGPKMAKMKFGHRRADYQRMYEAVQRFAAQEECSEVVIGLESTGVYGIPLQHFLMNKPVKLVQVNPYHTKRAKEIIDNSPNKTDGKDPEVMADIIQLGRFLTVALPEGVIADLRALIHARERAVENINRFYNQLSDIVFVVFPELLDILPELRGKTVRRVLQSMPTPDQLVALGKEALVTEIRTMSRGRIKSEKAEALFEAAKTSVGVRHGQSGLTMEIQGYLKAIKVLEEEITSLEEVIKERLQDVPYSKWILSIRGIGPIMTAGIIGELADLPGFDTIDEVIKFAGLNLYELSSGKRQGKHRISKRGRSLLRKFLYFAIIVMIRREGIFYKSYHEYIGEGHRMGHYQAIVALMRKLLRIIFAVVHKEIVYKEDYIPACELKDAA